jgi:hypothetical protein
MSAPNSIKAQIDNAKCIIRQQMARIAELEAEVERLRSAANAHDVLKSIYSDASQPTGHRLKAAGLALGVESAPLKPVESPLDLVAEEIEPLPVVIERQRARADAMLREARDIEVSPSGVVRVLPKPGSNGSEGSGD